jgi:predicted house-cleaning NTP pyrophosphatase (Maf/HAM1 superfamily)
MQIILASSSPYRRRLLQRLVPEFQCESPQVDETPGDGETADALAGRLALAKARNVAAVSARC